MNGPLRVIDTGLRAASWNIAMTAAMTELHHAGRIPDTLRFHRYPSAVLLGRHQPLRAIDRDACRRRGVAIARRVTGGGAVYMTPEVLAFDLVIDRRAAGGSQDAAAALVCGALARALTGLAPERGLDARFTPPNAVTIGGRKVVGASGCCEGMTLAHQGAIMVAMDFAAMAEVLALPEAGLRRGLTCLRDALGAPPDHAWLMAALTQALARALSRSVAAASPAPEELTLTQRLLAEEIGSAAFIAGEEAEAAALAQAVAS